MSASEWIAAIGLFLLAAFLLAGLAGAVQIWSEWTQEIQDE